MCNITIDDLHLDCNTAIELSHERSSGIKGGCTIAIMVNKEGELISMGMCPPPKVPRFLGPPVPRP